MYFGDLVFVFTASNNSGMYSVPLTTVIGAFYDISEHNL